MKKPSIFSMILLFSLFIPSVYGQTFTQAPTGYVYTVPAVPENNPIGEVISTAIASKTDISAVSDYGIDFIQLRKDYLSIAVEQSTNTYLKSEVGGERIVSHQSLGKIGIDENGNYIYKDLLTLEFTILTYSKYSLSSVWNLRPFTSTGGKPYVILQYQNLGVWLSKFEYFCSFAMYNYENPKITNGASLSIPVSVKFELPMAGKTIGNYRIVDMDSRIITMRTSAENPVTGVISTTDPKYVASISDQQTSITAEKDYDDNTIAKYVSDYKLGISNVGDHVRIDKAIIETFTMGKNSRLDTTSQTYSSSRKGTFVCSVGADFYYMKQDLKLRSATVFIDKFGIAQSTSVDRLGESTVSRVTSYGVENHFLKQKVEVQVEIISPVKNLAVDDSVVGDLDLPIINNTDVSGDTAIGTESIDGTAPATYTWGDIFRDYAPWVIGGLGTLVVIAAIIYFAPQLLALKKAADSTKLFKF